MFIPRVLEHHRRAGITGKVVLILDNAPSHPSLDELNGINKNFEVVYLPPNVTALIQPMDQGLISTTKKLYKKELLKRLLLNDEVQGAENFLRNLDLSDCLSILRVVWDSLKSSTLQKVWKPLLGDSIVNPVTDCDPHFNVPTNDNEHESPTDLSFSHDIVHQASQLLTEPDSSSEKSRDFLLKWLENERYDCGWEPLSDNDIVNFVTNGKCQIEVVNDIEEKENMCGIPDSQEIKPSEALEGLQKFKKWMTSNTKFSQLHLRYVEELENVTKEEKFESRQNKLYLQL